jgi:hypothetical protein
VFSIAIAQADAASTVVAATLAVAAPDDAAATVPARLPPASSQEPPVPSELSAELGLGVLAHGGFQPFFLGNGVPFKPSVAVAIAPSVVVLLPPHRSWGILFAGAFSLPSTVISRSDDVFEVSFKYGVLGPCWVATEGRAAHALLCSGALVGYLAGGGQDRQPWVAGPFVQGRLSFGDRRGTGAAFPYLAFGLVVPIARAEFTDQYHSTSFGSSAVAGTADVGVAFRFP